MQLGFERLCLYPILGTVLGPEAGCRIRGEAGGMHAVQGLGCRVYG